MPAGSLAADSAVHSGAFAANNMRSETASKQSQNQSSSGSSSANGAPAPTYVSDQYVRDPRGPHGKNITEGFADEPGLKDGTQQALKAEPGSINDPSREAEKAFDLKDKTRTRDAGPREHHVTDGNKYDNLGEASS